MRGQIEVLGNEVQMSAKRQRDMYVDLDTRLKRFEQTGAPPAAARRAAAPAMPGTPPASAGAPPPAAPGAPPAVVAGAVPPGQAANAPSPAESSAYEAAQEPAAHRQLPGRDRRFPDLHRAVPEEPARARAQYWIGDSYYNLRDYRNAIANQKKLIATYPDSASMPDALLNIASCQIELGDTAGARKTMDGLVARYPASEAAEKAKRRLATLRSGVARRGDVASGSLTRSDPHARLDDTMRASFSSPAGSIPRRRSRSRAREGRECHCLTVDYGQRHRAELAAAARVARALGAVGHRIVALDLAQFGGSALTDPRSPSREAPAPGIPVTYVPARNTILLALALAWAEVLGAQDIWFGANAVDYSGYPDCRPEYMRAFEALANLATKAAVEGRRLTLHTPIIDLDQGRHHPARRRARRGLRADRVVLPGDAPMALACGRCDACRLRRAGFEAAGDCRSDALRRD